MWQMLGYVALGGALGSVLRALVGMTVAFPLGTLTVNIAGSFAIGIAWALGVAKSPALHPFVMLGLLGGFTTFSTFSLDVLRLYEGGHVAGALGYVLASVVLSLAAVALGLFLGARAA
ncbi:MAG: fluoride efflux transporter CrcB [Pseudomonadota bacterium]